MARYRKKPVVIEAIQFLNTSPRIIEILEFVGEDANIDVKCSTPSVSIETLEGTMTASVGDYIIKGVQGEFYPCKPDIFEQTYEKVD